MNKYFAFTKKNDETTEITIYGDITAYRWVESDVTHYDFAKDLAQVDTPNLAVRINSYGGAVDQALGIYNLLKDFKGNLVTICDGFACSAASVIFMAGKTRIMPKTSLLMIHNAWTWASGNSDDFKKMAEDLAKINGPIIQSYVENTGLSESKVKKMMDEETWLTADEAFKLGFATNLQENVANASVESSILFNLVEKLKKLENKPIPQEPMNSWEQYFGKN